MNSSSLGRLSHEGRRDLLIASGKTTGASFRSCFALALYGACLPRTFSLSKGDSQAASVLTGASCATNGVV